MPASRRSRAFGRTFGWVVGLLRRARQRAFGVEELTPEVAAEMFEAGALELRTTMKRLTALSQTVLGVRERRLRGAPVPTWRFSSRRVRDGRTVLYMHGGAYVAGSHATHRLLVSAIAKRADAHAVLPEYRLAPEHPFPAALEDALATYRWLLEQGVAPDRLVLAGDSAGGGLAMSLALAVRDAGLPNPAGLALLSPWVDLTASGESITSRADVDLWLDGDLVAVGGSAYAPGNETDPLASPLFADLAGLPPMLVHVGTHEVLLDDSRRLVARARAAGVAAELGEFEGMWHVFQAFVGLPETTWSLRELGAWIRRITDHPGSAVPLVDDDPAAVA